MKKNLFNLAALAALLISTVSCSKQEELPAADVNQQANSEGIVRAAAVQVDYIANDVDWCIYTKNILTCDKYGNAYYVSREDYYSSQKIVKVDGSSLATSTFLSDSQLLEANDYEGMGIAVNGNGDLFVSTIWSVRKYNTSGTSANINFTPMLVSKSSLGQHPLFFGIAADMNDNIYIYNGDGTWNEAKSELYRITKVGGVQLLSTNQPLYLKFGGLYKGKGANLFGVEYVGGTTTYAHMYSNSTPTVIKESPLAFQSIGAGMDNGFLYVLSGYTIQRVNPTNGAVALITPLPQEKEIDGRMVRLGMPTHIAPTPDASAFYVAYAESSTGGYLFKVTL